MNKRSLLSIVCLSLTLAVMGIVSGSAIAQPPWPPDRDLKASLWLDDPLPMLHLPLAQSPRLESSDQASPLAVNDLAGWSTMAFQSFQDGNWEIYLARGDGSQPVRLTTDSNSDLRPRLNRGATRVAFSSNRDGNYEVYTMNADGAGATRLTFDGANDASPFWSPDSTRLTFTSNRDGNWEIYVMNADGTGQARLTYDAADDIAPAWSPDGSQITWVRRSSGGNAVWVMNADGANPHALTGPLAYLQNPLWSPDGARLAFDYDADGDYWNELVVINADGSGLHVVYDPNDYLVDLWMGSWSPDGDWLLFSRVEYIIHQNQLYLNHTYVEQVSLSGGSATRLTSSGYDMTPDWQTVDITPPQSQVSSLPQYSRASGVTVQWSGIDVGLAGIEGYDLQYRTGLAGVWTGWLTDTLLTSSVFSGTPGATVYFRSRARDEAGNVEAWPPVSDDAFTTLYAWKITGMVQDNRDTPLAGVTAVTLGSLNAIPSDNNGHFTTYSEGNSNVYTVTWSKSGYGELSPTRFDAARDVTLNIVLPPPNNVVKDGEFESGGVSSPWLRGGSDQPTYIEGLTHTGNWAIAIGIPADTLCVKPTAKLDFGLGSQNHRYTSIRTALSAAQPGQTVLVFPGIYLETLYMATSGVHLRSVMGPLVTIIDSGYAGTGIDVNKVHDVSIEGFTIQHGAPGLSLYDVDNSVFIRNNRFVENESAAGGAVIFDYTFAQIVGNWFIDNRTRGWSPPTPTCIRGIHGSPTIANNIFWNNPGQGACLSLYYQVGGAIYNNTFAGNYSGLEGIRGPDIRNNIIANSTLTGIGSRFECPIVFSYNDVWGNNPNYSTDCSDQTGLNGNISSDPLFADVSNGDFRLLPDSPAKDRGDPSSAFKDPDGSRNDMGAWGGPWALSRPEFSPVPLWTHQWLDLGPWAGQTISVTFVVTNNTSGGARSILLQVITLTEALTSPTLSFFYHITQDPAPGTETFAVLINSDSGAQAGFPIQSDLAGEIWVFLDEITIGSAYPDLWINKTSPTVVPGEQVAYTIVYGNQGSIPANETRITDTLPTELSFVDAKPSPIISNTLLLAWVWNIGDVSPESEPFTIIVTVTVAPTVPMLSSFTNTVGIAASTPELEKANNVAQATTFVGYRVHLPIALRETP